MVVLPRKPGRFNSKLEHYIISLKTNLLSYQIPVLPFKIGWLMTDRFMFGVVCQSVTVTLKSFPLGQHARKVTFKSGNASMDHHFSMRPRCTPSPFSPHLTNTLAGIRVNFPLALHPLKFSFSNNIAGYLSVGCGSTINDKIFLKKSMGKTKHKN